MRRLSLIIAACTGLVLLAAVAQAQQIRGEYIESRSADVYTGPCYGNAEAGLAGDQAIVAWRVEKGSWNGVKLDGLSVVGVAKAAATLGNPYGNPFPAKAVLIFDERATAEQRTALQSFAQDMAGELLKNIVRTETAPINLAVEYHGEHPMAGKMQAGHLAGITTRMISDKDHLCGNEEVYYPPLSQTSHAMPAVVTLDQFKGEGLGVTWTTRDKRSAFVGNFVR